MVVEKEKYKNTYVSAYATRRDFVLRSSPSYNRIRKYYENLNLHPISKSPRSNFLFFPCNVPLWIFQDQIRRYESSLVVWLWYSTHSFVHKNCDSSDHHRRRVHNWENYFIFTGIQLLIMNDARHVRLGYKLSGDRGRAPITLWSIIADNLMNIRIVIC